MRASATASPVPPRRTQAETDLATLTATRPRTADPAILGEIPCAGDVLPGLPPALKARLSAAVTCPSREQARPPSPPSSPTPPSQPSPASSTQTRTATTTPPPPPQVRSPRTRACPIARPGRLGTAVTPSNRAGRHWAARHGRRWADPAGRRQQGDLGMSGLKNGRSQCSEERRL